MNSDKAAEVRDAINTLPTVAHEPEESFAHLEPGDEFRPAGGLDRQLSGPHVRLDKYGWSPAWMEQTGEIGFGDDPVMRPNYDVFLRPLYVPTRPLPAVSLSPDLVHEVAKFGCRLRVYAGFRERRQPGLVVIKDDLAHDQSRRADSDLCRECGCSRWRLRDGEPECARCGLPQARVAEQRAVEAGGET